MANNTRSVLVVGLGRFGSSVAATLDMMRALKRAWDPANILNPGKIFTLPAAR